MDEVYHRVANIVELAFHRLDGLCLPGCTPGALSPIQGSGRVLKERLLPLVKHRRMDPVLLTNLADWHLLQKM